MKKLNVLWTTNRGPKNFGFVRDALDPTWRGFLIGRLFITWGGVA